ncbi:S1/P1 nuclease [Peziza echinospora]|nr:S1/P1 nuclease [Peziza echinospora]
MKPSISHSPLLPLLLLLPTPTIAWGQLPHRTIAILSTRYLLPETAQWVRQILPSNESIANAAVWADYYSHTPEGRWSGELHYIDAHDDPSAGKCDISYERDCREGGRCVVGGIVNATNQLLLPVPGDGGDGNDDTYEINSPTWRSDHHLALRFLLHFIADVHQPLHTEGTHRGGNSIQVLFKNRQTNLHSVWDTLIPEYLLHLPHGRRSTPRDAVEWADKLHARMLARDLSAADFQQHWVGKCFSGIDRLSKEVALSDERTQLCAMEWGSWANKYVCNYVFSGEGGIEGMEGRELAYGGYAEGARDIVEELVEMAGWRLAGWMNLLVTGRTGLDFGAPEASHPGQGTSGQKILKSERVGAQEL